MTFHEKNEMSNIWSIHVPFYLPSGEASYWCRTSFEISSWVLWLWKNIPEEAKKEPDKPVEACWVNEMEQKIVNRDFYPGDLIMIEARFLKGIKFHEDTWTKDRCVNSKAIAAFLNQLPDDWPCFLYQT
jgi:hypothetical protein